MTAQCPQCGNSVPDDFGVVTCSSCQAVLFVDLEGRVQLQQPASENSENQATQFLNPATTIAEMPSDYESPTLDPVIEQFQPETLSEPLSTHSVQQEESAELQDIIQIQPIPDLGQDPFEAFAPNSGPGSSFEEVERFANSDESVGALTYSVIIEDINTKELRQELLRALDDAKFQWDARELVKEVKDGRLLLDRLNPVKASILVQRVKGLKIKIRWRQNVF